MQYLALACDYDGTLACNGRVSDETLTALEEILKSGRKLILVTGRQLEELLLVFPQVRLFERVVVENGAVLYRPNTEQIVPLADSASERLVAALRERKILPLSVGRVIVATQRPHNSKALELIFSLGLDHEVILNKEAVMILPRGVNKGTGLQLALEELDLSPGAVVGVGDAENDVAFLDLCGYAAAVGNALPQVKEKVDFVTLSDQGQGIVELVKHLLTYDS